jgi:AraC family cel operon transcriptional repressor
MSASKITLLDLSPEIVKDGFMFWCGTSRNLQFHDFFEISLVMEGQTRSMINGVSTLLEPGTLIVIRPYDVHLKTGGNIANFGVSVDTFNSLFDYLGCNLDRGKFLRTQDTPAVILDDADRLRFKRRIDEAYMLFNRNSGNLASLESRVLLLELFIKFVSFLHVDEHGQAPSWLEGALVKMEQPQYFVEGLPALSRLTGRSQSYICRAFRKYYNMSPTQHINNLRLKYAAYLLDTTEIDILRLSGEVGFNSLSHFYHCFKKFYKIPPKSYKKLKKPSQSTD